MSEVHSAFGYRRLVDLMRRRYPAFYSVRSWSEREGAVRCLPSGCSSCENWFELTSLISLCVISFTQVTCDKKHELQCQEVNYRSATVCDVVQRRSNVRVLVIMVTLLTVFFSRFVWFCVQ